MRSSNKSRSRNKGGGRSRNIGNIVNRVFESAGPEGKVRGTPQQIIEKYQGLARDAQLSNDRVAAENFQQHAEHYARLLDEAQREQAERQAADDRKRQQQGGDGDDRGDGGQQHEQRGQDRNQDRGQQQDRGGHDRGQQQDRGDERQSEEVLGQERDDAGLVDTPESKSDADAQPKKPRRTRRSAPKGGAGQNGEGKQAADPPVQ